MRCIQRREGLRGGEHGWQVAIRRKHPTPCEYSKVFSDVRYGGKAESLLAAQAWRDEIERQYPRKSKLDLAVLVREHNTSGTAGVYRKLIRHKTKNGSIKTQVMWQAQSPAALGPLRSRSFAVTKYGEDGARQKAIAARKEFEAELAELDNRKEPVRLLGFLCPSVMMDA